MDFNKIPEYAKEYIVQEIRKEKFNESRCHFWGLYEADRYAHQMVVCWDNYNFDNKLDAEYTYRAFVAAQRIRTWCRRNKATTRKGSYHSFDGRRDTSLWSIVNGSALDNECEGLRWSIRKVDGLKNIYIWF